jgi:predicted TPR repeat methyltransferase
MTPEVAVRLLGPPDAEGEYVALRESGRGEDLVHLHDYERLYGVPGLYEHIVQDLLGCRSPQVAVDGLADALAQLEVDPADVVLLDLGAGTGLVGELASRIGVPRIVGVDALPAARAACLRDRHGIYGDYLVGDLAAGEPRLLADIRAHRPTALVSAGAMGGTHAPPTALVNALAILPADAPVVFTIDERWMQTDGPGGYRTAVQHLFDSGELRLLGRSRFQHRVTTTGEPIQYELVVGARGRS